MKKIGILSLLGICLLFTGCFEKVQDCISGEAACTREIIDDCVTVDGEDSCAVDIEEPAVEEPTYEILEWTGYMGCIGGCGDGIEGIKMSDEDVPEDYYQYEPDEENCQPVFYPLDHEIFPYADIMEEKIKNGFCSVESCMHTLDQYQPERMPGDPQTQITVACGPVLLYGDTYITGYIYTSVHPDLGLRITSPKGDDTFYVKSETPIFIRNGDKISHGQEYIKVYEKSANESLFDIVESNLNKGCFAQPFEYEEQSKVYGNINNKMIYNIVDKDGNIWSDTCIADNEATEQNDTIVRYFESLDKTKYYKLVFTDGCAPGPCSMFDEVEIF